MPVYGQGCAWKLYFKLNFLSAVMLQNSLKTCLPLTDITNLHPGMHAWYSGVLVLGNCLNGMDKFTCTRSIYHFIFSFPHFRNQSYQQSHPINFTAYVQSHRYFFFPLIFIAVVFHQNFLSKFLIELPIIKHHINTLQFTRKSTQLFYRCSFKFYTLHKHTPYFCWLSLLVHLWCMYLIGILLLGNVTAVVFHRLET